MNDINGCAINGRYALRIRIIGRVQGVGYRFWAEGQAEALGLDGWVRNRLDGSVEVLAVGTHDQVEALVRACHQGPALARVEQVLTETTPGIVARGFTRKPTV